jgi:hypothetical protein
MGNVFELALVLLDAVMSENRATYCCVCPAASRTALMVCIGKHLAVLAPVPDLATPVALVWSGLRHMAS